MSLIAACAHPDRIAAAASFHGGRLAVADDPQSPHLAADRITATVYIAGAVEDATFTTDQAKLLDAALTEAGVTHKLETYPARHGSAVRDNPCHDAQAEAPWPLRSCTGRPCPAPGAGDKAKPSVPPEPLAGHQKVTTYPRVVAGFRHRRAGLVAAPNMNTSSPQPTPSRGRTPP